jgi:hypothetical protein
MKHVMARQLNQSQLKNFTSFHANRTHRVVWHGGNFPKSVCLLEGKLGSKNSLGAIFSLPMKDFTVFFSYYMPLLRAMLAH